MGSPVADLDALPEPWTLVQGWRAGFKGGHTFLVLDSDERTGHILTLEANSAYNLNGVGFRHLGNISEFPDMHPGERWWADSGLWTWKQFRKSYPNMKMAELYVYDMSWVRGNS